MIVEIKCRVCSEIKQLSIESHDLVMYQDGSKKVQEAFPYLTPSQRELFVTQYCSKCWDKLFNVVFTLNAVDSFRLKNLILSGLANTSNNFTDEDRILGQKLYQALEVANETKIKIAL